MITENVLSEETFLLRELVFLREKFLFLFLMGKIRREEKAGLGKNNVTRPPSSGLVFRDLSLQL